MTKAAPLALLLTLLALSSLSGAERIDAKTWQRVKTYDMPTLKKMEPLPMRMIVGVRFDYRNANIMHLKPNWFHGSIWHESRSGGRADVDNIPVMVAKADVPAFRALPTTFEADRKFVVYGQVLNDADANYIFLRLLGTKVQRDRRGNATISW
jgi:hypothetical protein